MSRSNTVIRVLSGFILSLLLCVTVVAQQKAGALKLKPYAFENSKGEKTPAELGTLFVPERRASKGDFTNPAEVYLDISRDGIGSAMSFMMDCASGQTAARREQIQREAKGTCWRIFSISHFPRSVKNGTHPISGMNSDHRYSQMFRYCSSVELSMRERQSVTLRNIGKGLGIALTSSSRALFTVIRCFFRRQRSRKE